MILEEEFEKFMKAIHHGTLAKSSTQWKESRKAFFAGCIVAMNSKEELFPQILQYVTGVANEIDSVNSEKNVIN